MLLFSSSWPSSWSKDIFNRFLILTAAIFLFASPLHAQNLTAPELVLTDQQSEYDATPLMYHTRDATGDLGLREIYLRHHNNIRGERLPEGLADFSFDPVAHWLVIDIVNKSHKSDWLFDFGSVDQGRTGLTPQLIVQDGGRAVTLADSSFSKLSDIHTVGHLLPLRLMPDQRTTLVIFFKPSDHAPFVLTPRVIEASTLMDAGYDWMQKTVLLLIIGTCVFFMGCMFLRRGVGFFPYMLFFASQGAWLWLSGGHIAVAMPGAEHLPGVALGMSGLMALAVTQSIMAAQDTEAGDSLVLYICATFLIFAILTFAFLVPEGTFMRLGVIAGATALAYISAGVKAFMIKREMRWAGITAGCAWIIMAIAIVLPFAAALKFIPLSPLMLQAPYLAMPLVCVLMLLSGSAYVRGGSIALVREVLRQAQRQQAANQKKQTKESADQARLLRVIEREREIMEDLRAREADRTEEMRIAKIGADEANRAKSAFLAVVSHEIRTPMTGIMGMVRLLLDTAMTREQRDYAQTIQDSGDAMLALLNDILDFSKIQTGGFELETIDFDLHRVINSVVMLMSAHAAQRGIYLQTNIDPDAPRFLRGDPTRLRQVLLNLVGNAIKFTPRGGVTIHVRAGDAALVMDKPNFVPIEISVEDTGIGISEEAQQNLFSPFSQADSSIARKFGGTGLGLAICKRLIEAMGSEIVLTSVESHGTTFAFTLILPVGDQSAAQAEGNQTNGAQNVIAQPLHILVVDDNAINRKVMEGLLSRDNHIITTADSGAAALDILRTQDFDLIFLDIEMPDMNGLDVMRVLVNAEERIAKIPVVALTGNVAEEDRVRYRTAGMRDALAKPIDPDRLRAVLADYSEETQQAPSHAAAQELEGVDLDSDSFFESMDETSPVVSQPMAHHSEQGDGIFDFNMLESLRKSLGDGQLREMMAGVFEHNRNVLPTLQRAVQDNDVDTLRGCAHELKGMNANFGLKAIADISAIIENACRGGQPDMNAMGELAFRALPEAIDKTEIAFNS